MAELAVMAVAYGGAYVGAAYGAIGTAVGWTLGAALGNALFVHNDQEGPRLSDTRVQSSAYGTPINITWGSTRVDGNIIWAPPITEHKQSQKVGSFLGIGGSTVTTYSYTATFAVGVCEGPIARIRRIWANGTLIYSRMGADSYITPEFPVKIYRGTQTQTFDPNISEWCGINDVPKVAHRGLCYVVFADMPLEDYGNRIPTMSFEIVRGTDVCPTFTDWPVADLVADDLGATWTLARSETLTAREQVGHYYPDLQRAVFGLVSEYGNLSVVLFDTSSYPPRKIKEVSLDHTFSPNSGLRLMGCHGGFCLTETPADGWGTPGKITTSGTNLFFMLVKMGGSNYVMTVNVDAMIHTHTTYIQPLYGIPWGPYDGYNDDFIYPYDRVAMRWDHRNLVLHIQESWMNKGFPVDYAGYPAIPPARIVPMPGAYSVATRVVSGLTRSDGAVYSWTIPRPSKMIDELSHENYWLDLGQYGDLPYSACWDGWSQGPAFCLWSFGTGSAYDTGLIARITTYLDLDGHVMDLPSSVTFTIHNGLTWDSKRERFICGTKRNIYFAKPGWGGGSLYLLTELTIESFREYFDGVDQSWFSSVTESNGVIDALVYFPNFDAVGVVLHFSGDSHVVTFLLDPGTGEIIDGGCYYNGPGNQALGNFIVPVSRSLYAITGSMSGSHVYAIPFGTSLAVEAIKLYDIVDDVSERMGVTAAKRETSSLDDDVWGYQLGRPMTGRAAIEGLQAPYFFDPVESGATMRFVKRGGALVATLPIEDLAVIESSSAAVPPAITTKRALEQDLPRRVTFRFQDPDRAYDQNSTYAERLETQTVNDVVFDLPVVMQPDEAQWRCESMLYESWMARTTAAFTTGPRWAHLEPTDPIAVTSDDGMLYRLRLTKKTEHGVAGSIAWEAVEEDDGLFSRPVVENIAADFDDTTQPTNTSVARMVLMDIPVVDYAEPDVPMLRVAVNGAAPGGAFPGAELFSSTDDTAYEQAGVMVLGATVGYALTALPALTTHPNDPCCADTVRVVLHHGTLLSCTWLELLSGANFAWLGGEVIQFQRADLVETDTYDLSGILRARGGTEDRASMHSVGEDFVLLNPAAYALGVSSYTPTVYYAAVTRGLTLTGAPRVKVTTAKRHALPLSPTELRVGKNSAGDIIVSWTRRDRHGMHWYDFVDAPETDGSGFVITFGSPNGTATVREISVDAETYTYAYAEWTSDFATSPPAASGIGIAVYQVSANVGRGTPARVTFIP